MVTKIEVPETFEAALIGLKKIIENAKPDEKEAFLNDPEDDACGRLHFGLGMWLRNNWGLWGGGALQTWFNSKGIKHADDMSGILITTVYRQLHNQPIDLDRQIVYY